VLRVREAGILPQGCRRVGWRRLVVVYRGGGAQNAAEASTIAEQASSNSDELIEGQTPASYSIPLVSAAPLTSI